MVSSDEFLALPASQITNNGFTANWTVSASASGYILNVFSLKSSGATQAKTLLEEDFLSGLPSGWTSVPYTDNTLASNIRLASGSSGGKISTPALNLSTSGTVLTVRAKQYNADAGALLTATLDNQPLTIWTTAVANQDFTVTIPQATASSVISLSAATSSRVYVDYVKVQTQGSVQTAVSVSGYPKSVGNSLNYLVDGLIADSTYYYSIQPEGNAVAMSNQIQVRTGIKSGINENKNNTIHWSVSSNGLSIKDIPTNSRLRIIDFTGKFIQSIYSTSAEINVALPAKGIYLLQVESGQTRQNYKVLY